MQGTNLSSAACFLRPLGGCLQSSSFHTKEIRDSMTGYREIFISVDVETAGPIPGDYSLLEIGACSIENPALTFTCELKPLNHRSAHPEALKTIGLSLDELERNGLPPREAMLRFDAWIQTCLGPDDAPIFVGLNAPFDWSFINYYFHHFLGRNPFGFTALDIKALYMGATGCSWENTRSRKMAEFLKPQRVADHKALHDAEYQAELFCLIREIIFRS